MTRAERVHPKGAVGPQPGRPSTGRPPDACPLSTASQVPGSLADELPRAGGRDQHGELRPAVGTVTDVGSYTGSASPTGTFDQGGNVREWSEAVIGSNRALRRASFTEPPSDLAASSRNISYPTNEYSDVGFRLASVPEPTTATLRAVALALLATRRRRTRNVGAA